MLLRADAAKMLKPSPTKRWGEDNRESRKDAKGNEGTSGN
jgi:hypothetical protein